MSQSTTDAPNVQSETVTISANDYYRIMASERRRALLDVLDDRPTPVSVDDLSMDVAEREGEAGRGQAGGTERVAITLHHHHLPVLSDVGVIDYDPTSGRVESFRGLTR